MNKNEICLLARAIVILIITAAVLAGVFGLRDDWFTSVADGIVTILLGLVIKVLYLISAELILLGSVLLTIRYIHSKLSAPLQPVKFEVHARFLTVGLEILIGAEIINTAITKTFEGFLVLTLTILTRGLIALILHMEEKWTSPK